MILQIQTAIFKILILNLCRVCYLIKGMCVSNSINTYYGNLLNRASLVTLNGIKDNCQFS